MKYYILSTSTESKNTAIIDGFEPNYYPKYNPDNEFSQQNLNVWEFYSKEPVFSKLIFKRGFRLVDFIYPSTMNGCGFIISERIKKIILDFNLMNHKLYKLPIYEFKGIDYNYFLLQLVRGNVDYSMIDFEKSKFFSEERLFNENTRKFEWGNNIEMLSIKNANDYASNVENCFYLSDRVSYYKLVLHKKPKDLFLIHDVHNSEYLISERLKQKLEEMKATGLENFVEIEIEYNEE